MKQIFHIFAKDARRFLPEILIVLALVTALFLPESYKWVFNSYSSNSGLGTAVKVDNLRGAILAFTFLAWFLLIGRAIQAERLAGDKQFWITRPYEWKKLLMAKLLFIVAFIYIPLFTGIFIGYIESGIPLRSFFTMSPLWALESIAVPLLLATAIATVTTNVAGMMGGNLLAFISMSAMFIVPYRVRPDSVYGPISGTICWGVFLVLCCAVIVLQYARRNTRLSISLLIAIPVLICAIQIFTPERHPPDRAQPSQTTLNKSK